MNRGVLEDTQAGWQLRFVRRLAHSREKVWRALTEDDHLAAWFPSTIEGQRIVGAHLTFSHEDHPGIDRFEGELLRYEPPALLEFTWAGDKLRFELADDGERTTLTLCVVFDELGKATRDGAGWHECLDALETHLDGGVPPKLGVRWRELEAVYRDSLPPEASTLGPPEGWEPPA